VFSSFSHILGANLLPAALAFCHVALVPFWDFYGIFGLKQNMAHQTLQNLALQEVCHQKPIGCPNIGKTIETKVSLGKGTLLNLCRKTDTCQIWSTQPNSIKETLAQNLVEPVCHGSMVQ